MPFQIMYSSQATEPMTLGGLEQILVDARSGNEVRNVTGALIYVDGVFLQILEGDEDVVRALMTSIARDTRHHSVKVFYEAAVGERSFGTWRMAYLNATAQEMSNWAGLAGTVTIDALLAEVGGNTRRVPRILERMLEALA